MPSKGFEHTEVVITPFGGQGSTKLARVRPHHEKVAVRVDAPFGCMDGVNVRDYSIYDHPVDEAAKSFKDRTGLELDLTKTINEILMWCITSGRFSRVLLHGYCSIVDPFLTRNGIKAKCVVRYPVNGYNSYFVGKAGKKLVYNMFGGYERISCIKWYARRWRKVLSDMITSNGDYYLYETASGSRTPGEKWTPSTKKISLSDETVKILEEETLDIYNQYKQLAIKQAERENK